MKESRILISVGELVLKGKNRKNFEQKLLKTIREKLQILGYRWKVRKAHGRIAVAVPLVEFGELREITGHLADLPGVVLVNIAEFSSNQSDHPVQSNDVEHLREWVVDFAHRYYRPDGSFAVRVRRRNHKWTDNSEQLEHLLGQAVRERTGWDRVDLNHPDHTIRVELQTDGVYLFAEELQIQGTGGLPTGMEGAALSLLSGGIDSPVASYLAARRGCRVDFLHFTVQQPDPDHIGDHKIVRLAQHLTRYQLEARLILVPYFYFDAALLGARTNFELTLFRRFKLVVAEQLAMKIGTSALITGDNLGQVASQTMDNIVSASRSVAMPVLRPLITHDKQEIIALARKIGTYDLSITPYKDCCALISRHPKTSSRHEKLSDIESSLFPEYDELVEQTLGDAMIVDLKFRHPPVVHHKGIEILSGTTG